jgi:hypothetical protein
MGRFDCVLNGQDPSKLRKTPWACRNFAGPHIWDNRRAARRMLKKTVQQGRSERRGEAYAPVR